MKSVLYLAAALAMASCDRQPLPLSEGELVEQVSAADHDQVLEFSKDITMLETADGITVRLENEGPIGFAGPYGFAGLSYSRKNEPTQTTSGLGVFDIYGRQVLVTNEGFDAVPKLVVKITAPGHEIPVLPEREAVQLAVAEAKKRGLDFVGYTWAQANADNSSVIVMMPTSQDKVVHYVNVNRLTKSTTFAALPMFGGFGFVPAREAVEKLRYITVDLDADSMDARHAVNLLQTRFKLCVNATWPEQVIMSWSNDVFSVEGFGDKNDFGGKKCLEELTREIEPRPDKVILTSRFQNNFVDDAHSGVKDVDFSLVPGPLPLSFSIKGEAPAELVKALRQQIRLSWPAFIACKMEPGSSIYRLSANTDGTVVVKTDKEDCFSPIFASLPIDLRDAKVRIDAARMAVESDLIEKKTK